MLLGSTNVYFQPPPNAVMKYPCIVYHWDFSNTQFADNLPYRSNKRYQITVIDREVDSVIADKLLGLPMCVFSRSYAKDNLNHFVFDLFF